jgi:hypothetical protein
MATPSSDEIAALVGEIRDLKNALDETSIDQAEIARRYDAALTGLLNAAGQFDTAAWDKLLPDDQMARAAALARLKQILEHAVATAEPVVRIPPGSYMYKKEASNGAILILTAIAVLGLVLNLCLIRAHWTLSTSGVQEPPPPVTATPTPKPTMKASPTPSAGLTTPTPAATTAAPATSTLPPVQTSNTEPASAKQTEGPRATAPEPTMTVLGRENKPVGPSEGDVLFMVMLLGALGGFLRLASSLANYVGNRQLLKSWIIYYLLTPIQGAALAPLVYLLLRVGVLNPATTTGSSSPTTSLNLIGIYAFAGLTGLFSKQAMEMLADVFSTIFKKSETKDALDKSKQEKAKPKEKADAG